MPIVHQRLRKSQDSPLKHSAKMLRQSIENIELENIEGDFISGGQGQKPKVADRSKTPERVQIAKLNAQQ